MSKSHFKFTLLQLEFYTNDLEAKGQHPDRVKMLRPLIKRGWTYLASGPVSKVRQVLRDVHALVGRWSDDDGDDDAKEKNDDERSNAAAQARAP